MIFRTRKTVFLLILLLPVTVLAGSGDDSSLLGSIMKLARQGDGEAQYSLALRYDMGEGLQRDTARAIHWYTRAAAQGVAGACFYLGMKYEFGNGVSKDVERAMALYRKAALQGWPMAQFFLGRLYLAGEGVRHDPVRAAAWLTLAAEQGYPNAAGLLQRSMAHISGDAQARVRTAVARLKERIHPAEEQ